jgi:acetyltransferase EpsM
VAHDCLVGDFCNLNPAATLCGNVQLGEGCSIGAGATVIEKVKIGAGTIVGAGAVVIRDLPPGVTAVGVPARVIKQHSKTFLS